MIQKNNIYFRLWSDFTTKKLAVNTSNNSYCLIGSPSVVTSGTPDIPFNSTVFIADKHCTWSKGKLYYQVSDDDIATISEIDALFNSGSAS